MSAMPTLFESRLTDPATSDAAQPHRVGVDQLIRDVLRAAGSLTDEEIVTRVKRIDSTRVEGTIKTCRSRMLKSGEIIATDKTRPTATGRASIVWRLA